MADLDRRLLDALADAVIASDASACVTYLNPAAERLLGWRREELVGRSLAELMPARFHATFEESFRRYVTTGEGKLLGRTVQLAARHRGGHEIPVEVVLSAIGDRDLVVATVRDVRERLELERLRVANRRIVAQHRVMSILAATRVEDDPMPAVLAGLGEVMGWEVGIAWRPDGAGALRAAAGWSAAGVEATGFLQASASMSFPPGSGLPGRAWSEARPIWERDVTTDPEFRRADAARAAGLHTALLFPVPTGTATHGVLEFLTRRLEASDDELILTFASIGFQIAQFLDRAAREAPERERERLAALIADALPQMIWFQRGDTESYNRRWYEYTGWPPDRDTRDAAAAIIHPDDQAAARAQIDAAHARPAAFEVELRMRRHDGAYRWHVWRAVPVLDERGGVAFWVGSASDIDDQRRAVERAHFLAEASALLGRTLDPERTLRSLAHLAVPRLADWCSIDAVIGGDTARRVVVAHVDPAKVAWAEAIAREYPPDPAATHGAARVLRTGQPELYSEIPDAMLVAVARDARHLAILREVGLRSVMIVPLVARGTTLGAITFVAAESGRRFDEHDLALARELADRAALAVDNARLFADAQEAIRARDDFLSIASHELRTPLTPLQLHLDDLRRRVGGDGDWHEPARLARKLDTVGRQVERIASLVERLLDISRITQGRLHLELEDLDLAATVREVAERLVRAAASSDVRLEVDAPRPVVGRWDRLRLDQIITNLITNAIKFGAGKPVTIQVAEVGGLATMTVRDRGIGIPPEDQARIFERFERAVSTRHYGGFGLGLWIVRQVVEALGGRITVESQPGEGALFTVTLPLVAADESSGTRLASS